MIPLSLPPGWPGYKPHDNATMCRNCPHAMVEHWTEDWSCRRLDCLCQRWGCPPGGH